jgi:hypothetical protein
VRRDARPCIGADKGRGKEDRRNNRHCVKSATHLAVVITLSVDNAWNRDRQESEMSLAKGKAALEILVEWFFN